MGMHVKRYSLDHGLLCVVCLYKLHLESPEGLCAFILYYAMAAAMAAAPARREKMPLHFLRLFVFFSSLLARALPTMD